jgi:hypothetical protein
MTRNTPRCSDRSVSEFEGISGIIRGLFPNDRRQGGSLWMSMTLIQVQDVVEGIGG